MRCLHPIIRKYLDIAGIEHCQEVPCGKCIACLHNFQDSWLVRLRETSFAYKDFVYDTLTFSPYALTMYDVTSSVLFNYEKIMSFNGVERLLNKYRTVDYNTGELRFRVPYIDRSIVRNWIKRARENYFLDKGQRLNIKYFIVYENGPVWSRPHFHLLMWGITHSDYVTYFAKEWRRRYGFTKTKFISNGSDADRDRITAYLSKYVSKGVFESPLVRVGLLPKPWRSISQGIGQEYLQRDFFDWFRGPFAEALRNITIDKSHYFGDIEYNRKIKYLIQREIVEDSKMKAVFDKVGERLKVYYDRQGYAHALPRYYKYKLCNGFTPNVLFYALQTYLLESTRVYYNSRIQRFAFSLGYRVNWGAKETPDAGFGQVLFDLLARNFVVAQRLQSKAEAKRRYYKLKNHYGRAMNLPAYMVG